MKKQFFRQKHQILSMMLLLIFTPAIAQDILWEKSYGGKHADYLFDVLPTADYGFLLAGSSLSKKTGNKSEDNRGDLDYWIWKMDEKGDLDWQKSFGGEGADFLQSIAMTNDGGFILAGNSSSNKSFDKKDDSKGQEDFWIIKLNAKGGEEWQKTIGGSGQEKLQSIQHTKDGGYIIGGSSSSEPSDVTDTHNKTEKTTAAFGNTDYWVVKLDAEGTIEWQQSFGGVYSDELRAIEQTSDRGFILGGYSNSPISGNKLSDNIGVGDYWIIKLNTTGSIEWQKTFGGDKDDQLYTIHQTYDNGYIVGGNSNSESSNDKSSGNQSGTDFWVFKLDEKGDMTWQETYDIAKVDVLTSLVENNDHSFLLGGYAQGEMNQKSSNRSRKAVEGTDDYVGIKINEKGEEEWRKTVGSDGQDILKKVIETRDGGYLFVGTSNPQSKPVTTKSDGIANDLKNNLSVLQGDNEKVQNAKNKINDSVNEFANDANQNIENTIDSGTTLANETVGFDKDSPLKIGNNQTDSPISLPSLGGGNTATATKGKVPEKKLPPSGEKFTNYGNSDFWVVKLKDEKKKIKEQLLPIEAIPNPAVQYTNIIVNHEFEKGTATVYDIAGRQLQSFAITDRTVPVDLGSAPAGIYIVEIRTNKLKGSVKVIKGNSKN